MTFDMETAKKTYAPHELQPSTPIHPGEILKDELEARNISQRKFAALIGVSYSVLNEVVNGKCRLHGETVNLPLCLKTYVKLSRFSDRV